MHVETRSYYLNWIVGKRLLPRMPISICPLTRVYGCSCSFWSLLTIGTFFQMFASQTVRLSLEEQNGWNGLNAHHEVLVFEGNGLEIQKTTLVNIHSMGIIEKRYLIRYMIQYHFCKLKTCTHKTMMPISQNKILIKHIRVVA